MKLTDLAIIFEMFFICILLYVHIEGNEAHNKMINQVMYNNVMDNITEDALKAGYKKVNSSGKPEIWLKDISDSFKGETDLYSENARYVLCYVDSDGFFVCTSMDGYKWSEKQYFSELSETKHEDKVNSLIMFFKEKYGINMLLPTNGGETWINTVKEYSLLTISYEKSLSVYCFSGALLH